MNLEMKGNCAEQQKIINTLLHNSELNNMFFKDSHPEMSTHGEYIDLILGTLDKEIVITQNVVLQNYNQMNKDVLNEQFKYESRLFRQSSLWAAINKIYTDDFVEFDNQYGTGVSVASHSMAFGYSYAQIDDLISNGNTYEFDFSIFCKEEDFTNRTTAIRELERKFDCSVTINQGIDIELVKKKIEIYDKRYEMKLIPVKIAWDVSVGLISKGVAGYENVVGFVDGISNNAPKDCIDNVMSFPYSDYCEKMDELNIPLPETQAIIDGIFQYYELQDDIAKIQTEQQQLIMGKSSNLSMGFEDNSERMDMELQGQTQTAVSIVRSDLLLNGDGLKCYFEDVCDEMPEDEIDKAITIIMATREVKASYNNYLKGQTIENELAYIQQLKKTTQDELINRNIDNKIDVYGWIQGGDLLCENAEKK